MEIYVQSRGFSPDHDYNWVNQNQKIVEEPKIVENFTVLLQKESPSLLIARENNQLLLLVTGIKSKNRRDYQNRINRISVAWIGTNEEEERQLLALAVRTLKSFLEKDTLIDDIEILVKDKGKNGFTVEFDQLEIEKLTSQINVEREPLENDDPKIHKKNDERLQELATELERYCLPPKEGALVVVTGIQKRETLQKANVWRGFGNLVDEPGGQPEEGDKFRADRANNKKNPRQIEGEVRRIDAKYSGMDQGKIQRIVVPVLAVFLCISLSLNIWLYAQSNQQNQKINAQNEKIESLNQQIQTLTLERDNVQKPLKTQ